MIQKPIIIIGTGGHAKVLIDTLKSQSANIIGVTNPAPELYGKDIMGIPIIGDDESILQYGINDIGFVNKHKMVLCDFLINIVKFPIKSIVAHSRYYSNFSTNAFKIKNTINIPVM